MLDLVRRVMSAAICVGVMAVSSSVASAADGANTPLREESRAMVTPSVADRTAAGQALSVHAVSAHLMRVASDRRAEQFNALQMRHGTSASSSAAPLPPAIIYPDDLIYNGGPVIKAAELHNVYVDCAYSCFGNPGDFLTRLGQSNFIHDIDQYVGATANNRYRYAGHISAQVPIYTHTLYENDILAIVHAAAVSAGNKPYASVFNVFLPKGVDTCFDGTTSCYSPDVPSTFAFCGYHGSATFKDIGHVIYSVEPYADVQGCTLLTSSPNGLLTDAADSVLSHETFELLTDPDLNAWYTYPFGSEIGDNCAYLYNFEHLLGKTYELQTEYSNYVHGCVADYLP